MKKQLTERIKRDLNNAHQWIHAGIVWLKIMTTHCANWEMKNVLTGLLQSRTARRQFSKDVCFLHTVVSLGIIKIRLLYIDAKSL